MERVLGSERLLDLIYPYQATPNHAEINLSIRSVRKFCKGVRNIYIIGDNPGIPDTIHIQAYDVYDQVFGKNRNIMEKIYLACMQPDISDDFLMMNDDFFWLQETDIRDYPYYSGSFSHILDRKKDDPYRQDFCRTVAHFGGFGNKPDWGYFDIHKPIIYNKTKYIEAMRSHNWRLSLLVKSLYCNYWNIPGVPVLDHKGYHIPHETDMFSFELTPDTQATLESILSST